MTSIPQRTAILALTWAGVSSASAEIAAPDYYIEALFAVSTAEQLANFCPEIAFDLSYANTRSNALLERLAGDGISGDALTVMAGIEEGVAKLQEAFVARHGLASPSGDVVCEVARSEIAEASAVGAYLKDVDE
ncbi:MAG: DUF5333 family protein [Pseudomonadota bacterium]